MIRDLVLIGLAFALGVTVASRTDVPTLLRQAASYVVPADAP